jgi:hypothetical protein
VSTGTALKTIIALATGSVVANRWVEIDVSFNGISSTAAPIQVDLFVFTADGTGTTGTVQKYGAAGGETLIAALSAFKYNYTAEPTSKTVLQSWYVHPQTGMVLQFPLGREFVMGVSAFAGLQVTAGASVNCLANVVFEE